MEVDGIGLTTSMISLCRKIKRARRAPLKNPRCRSCGRDNLGQEFESGKHGFLGTPGTPSQVKSTQTKIEVLRDEKRISSHIESFGNVKC